MKISPDLINGLFEFLAAPFIWLSIRNLLKTKKVNGVSWIHVAFFTLWGYWNLFYYPQLEQWCSLAGGIAVVITNSIWVWFLIKYSRKGKNGYCHSDIYRQDI
jgi:hypothetical protein